MNKIEKDPVFIAGQLTGIRQTCETVVKLFWERSTKVQLRDWASAQINKINQLKDANNTEKGSE